MMGTSLVVKCASEATITSVEMRVEASPNSLTSTIVNINNLIVQIIVSLLCIRAITFLK